MLCTLGKPQGSVAVYADCSLTANGAGAGAVRLGTDGGVIFQFAIPATQALSTIFDAELQAVRAALDAVLNNLGKNLKRVDS